MKNLRLVRSNSISHPNSLALKFLWESGKFEMFNAIIVILSKLKGYFFFKSFKKHEEALLFLETNLITFTAQPKSDSNDTTVCSCVFYTWHS